METRRHRAWSDAKKWAFTQRDLVLALAPVVLTFLGVRRWGSSREAYKDVLIALGAGAAFAIVLPVVVFVASLATARGRILTAEVVGLKEKVKELGARPVETVEPPDAFDGQLPIVIRVAEKLASTHVGTESDMTAWRVEYQNWFSDTKAWLREVGGGYYTAFANLAEMDPVDDSDELFAFNEEHAQIVHELACRTETLKRFQDGENAHA